ncbi:hypothetical protein [Ensifer adhaerens]|uniref:hypothetical protein n=1 Tax=Ensifer adhaerens TaxID=106592 RepID=UPI0015C2CF42|nr:hypothetical protein [Ensifer adhaerens]
MGEIDIGHPAITLELAKDLEIDSVELDLFRHERSSFLRGDFVREGKVENLCLLMVRSPPMADASTDVSLSRRSRDHLGRDFRQGALVKGKVVSSRCVAERSAFAVEPSTAGIQPHMLLQQSESA